MSAAHPRTIVIVGAGFSGTALAAQLLRQGTPTRVVLVNRYGPMGRGVAYGTAIEAHRLNVPAGGMSAFPDDAGHFVRWARESDPAVEAGTFVSRRLYGEYLESVLGDAERAAGTRSRLERRVGQAADVVVGSDSAEVVFADGSRREGDRVVLALGNYSPANLPIQDGGVFASRRYVRDPWIPKAMDVVEKGDSALLIGSGLTMMDIAIDLNARSGSGRLYSVSRHGLMPRPHRPGPPEKAPEPPAPLRSGAASLAAIVRALRADAEDRAARGADWRQTVASIRAITPDLWKGLEPRERGRFLRHVRPYWEIHRHRAAPETAARIEAMLREGILSVRAGRIQALRETSGGAEADVRDRRTGAVETIRVSRIVNCTGPDSDVRRIKDPLLETLRARGTIVPDPLGLGLEAGPSGGLIDASGTASRVLFLLGPLLRARDWECTAVPELRAHAARLAAELLS
jgi:uncharacterized NAD(P)/FAD-binding protein YdhS